jgi:hypothetical protein
MFQNRNFFLFTIAITTIILIFFVGILSDKINTQLVIKTKIEKLNSEANQSLKLLNEHSNEKALRVKSFFEDNTTEYQQIKAELEFIGNVDLTIQNSLQDWERALSHINNNLAQIMIATLKANKGHSAAYKEKISQMERLDKDIDNSLIKYEQTLIEREEQTIKYQSYFFTNVLPQFKLEKKNLPSSKIYRKLLTRK